MWMTPRFRLAFVFFIALISVFIATKTATNQYKINYDLEIGMELSTATNNLTLEEIDFTAEPGEIEDYARLDHLYARQDQIEQMLHSPSITIKKGDQQFALETKQRTLEDLPFLYWIQLIVGLGALVISGWIWVLKPRDLASQLFFLSGFSTLLFSFAAAIYTTRALAINASLFRLLTNINAFGASLFGVSVIALFLVYPKRLKRYRISIISISSFFGIWTLASIFHLLPAWSSVNLITMVEMVSILIAIMVQFFATKGKPKERAALTWLGLSVLIGAGAFILLNATPLVFGKDVAIPQGYAFLFFLIIYLGLAAGIRNYRLFDVGQWAFKLLFYIAGAFFFILLDLALISLIGMDRFPALGLALLAVAFIYLPLRDLLSNFIFRRTRLSPEQTLEEVLHVTLAPSPEDQAKRWLALLKKIFNPLRIEVSTQSITEVAIINDGLGLNIPATASTPALQLFHPAAGRSLFSRQGQELAKKIISLIAQAESSRQAYDRGVSQERQRVAQDLHDDLGARLLTGLHSADEKHRPYFQEALVEVRTILADMAGHELELDRYLSNLRYESSRRLSALDIKLDWPIISEAWVSQHMLTSKQQKIIRSAIREIVSNTLKHSGANEMKVLINKNDNHLSFSISDNGRGISHDSNTNGNGLKNLKQRLSEVNGSFTLEAVSEGMMIKMQIPLS